MLRWFAQLDRVLRGDATLMASLSQGRVDVPAGGLAVVTVLLAALYGACMGSFAILHPDGTGILQVIASAVKLPALFFLTLAVTLPSLYVFNALVGSRLTIVSVVRLMVAMLGVMMAVLASLGPIVVFFSLSTTSYPFMKLLNVVVCAVAGFLGMAFLLRTLHRLVLVQETYDVAPAAPPPPSPGAPPVESPAMIETPGDLDMVTPASPPSPAGRGALDLVGDATHQRAKTVFKIWVVVFSLVGAQMSWVLRPFIGDPAKPFTWLRPREGNFFEGVVRAIGNLFG